MPGKSASRRPKSSKKGAFPDPHNKHSGRRRGKTPPKIAAPPEPTVEELKSELVEERAQRVLLQNQVGLLQNQLDSLQTAFDKLSEQSEELKSVIYESADEWKFEKYRTDLEQVDFQMLMQMLKHICHVAHHPPPTEIRMEEMETRITSQNSSLALLLANTRIYENALEDIFQTRDVEFIHDKVADAFLETGKVEQETPLVSAEESAAQTSVRVLPPRPVTPVHLRRLWERMKDIHLKAPPYRLGGDTHINEMNVELRRYICKDLNMEKKSGADWRMLAKRVGIEDSKVVAWQREKLVSPMQKVLSVWGQSAHATVRMLHRHLQSSEMKYHLLSKRIEDFYVVE